MSSLGHVAESGECDLLKLHTHVVISSKVQTSDGRWYARDGRVLKRLQQTFGYADQSALRAELNARYGVAFDEIGNGQAEITGVPAELLHQFSKRAHDIGPTDRRVRRTQSARADRPRVLSDGTRSVR